MMENLLDLRGHMIVCDNPACTYHYHVDSVKMPEVLLAFVNVPCPNCGQSLLTPQDYIDTIKFIRKVKTINRMFGWMTIFSSRQKKVYKQINIHDGKVNIKQREK